MGFLGLRRSPLKHADPRRREQAVRDLPVAEQGTLAEMALGDSDAGVRVAAAAKVREADLLALIARHKDEAVAKIGRNRLANIATETIKTRSLKDAKILLEAVSEQSALVNIALGADKDDVRQAAFERFLALGEVGDKFLGTLAIQDPSGAFGAVTVGRIGKRQVLKDIAKNAKADSVKTLATERIAELDAVAKKPSPEKQRRARAKDLAGLAERAQVLAVSERWDEVEAEFDQLQAQYQEILAEYPEIDPDDSCEDISAALTRGRSNFVSRRDEALARARQQGENAGAKRALLDAFPVEGDDDAIAEWSERYAAIGEAGDDEPALLRRRAEAMKEPVPEGAAVYEREAREPVVVELDEADQAVLDEVMTEAEQLRESTEWRDADQRFKELDKVWRVKLGMLASNDPRRVAFLDCYTGFKDRRRSDRESRKEQQADRIEQMRALAVEAEQFASLEPAADALDGHLTKLKALQAKWKDVGKASGGEVGRLRTAFRSACDKAYEPIKAMHEARDWERFNNVPKAEDLIERATALQSEEDLAAAHAGIKDVQAAWKGIGQLPRERKDELWQQFRTACDVVYERLQPLFAQRDEERSANFAKKEELVSELQALLDAPTIGMPGSQADKDAMQGKADKIKAMQDRWKEIGPVPREQDKDLWQRYKGLLDRFYASRREHYKVLDQERVENLNEKLALIVSVDELAEDVGRFAEGQAIGKKSEPDFLREVKDIQRRWREIGHVPRDRFDEVRDRFKASCDKIYQALEPWFEKQDAERQNNLERKEALIKELEELLEEEHPEWFKDDVKRIQNDWREAGQVPRKDMDINEKFQDLCDKIFNKQPD
ncbi:MAG: DUF349 domain-containing protein [Planctomycetota bacterium]|jgi:hypothetical protein|nr:DUF349 domain-containing protein [Planctomycetota bacterium]